MEAKADFEKKKVIKQVIAEDAELWQKIGHIWQTTGIYRVSCVFVPVGWYIYEEGVHLKVQMTWFADDHPACGQRKPAPGMHILSLVPVEVWLYGQAGAWSRGHPIPQGWNAAILPLESWATTFGPECLHILSGSEAGLQTLLD